MSPEPDSLGHGSRAVWLPFRTTGLPSGARLPPKVVGSPSTRRVVGYCHGQPPRVGACISPVDARTRAHVTAGLQGDHAIRNSSRLPVSQ